MNKESSKFFSQVAHVTVVSEGFNHLLWLISSFSVSRAETENYEKITAVGNKASKKTVILLDWASSQWFIAIYILYLSI